MRRKKNISKKNKKKQPSKANVKQEQRNGQKETIVVSKKNEEVKAAKKTKESKPTPKAKRNERPGIFARGINFFKDVKNELKKVTWPTPDELMKKTGIVAGVVTISTLYTWLIDSGFGALAALLLNSK